MVQASPSVSKFLGEDPRAMRRGARCLCSQNKPEPPAEGFAAHVPAGVSSAAPRAARTRSAPGSEWMGAPLRPGESWRSPQISPGEPPKGQRAGGWQRPRAVGRRTERTDPRLPGPPPHPGRCNQNRGEPVTSPSQRQYPHLEALRQGRGRDAPCSLEQARVGKTLCVGSGPRRGAQTRHSPSTPGSSRPPDRSEQRN